MDWRSAGAREGWTAECPERAGMHAVFVDALSVLPINT